MEKVTKPWGFEVIWAQAEKYTAKVLHLYKNQTLCFSYGEEKSLLIISGEVELEQTSEKQILGPGDSFHAQPELIQHLKALAETEVVEISSTGMGSENYLQQSGAW
jgi:mannose-6-phosphate isomerase-like protein (cupin superfamily)